MLSIQGSVRLLLPRTWKQGLIAQRGVWHAGYEHAKEAQEIAKAIEKLLTDEKNTVPDRLEKLQQEYEKLTGEKYDGN